MVCRIDSNEKMNFLEWSCLLSNSGVNVTVNYLGLGFSLPWFFLHIYVEETMRFVTAFTSIVEACHFVDYYLFKQNTITVEIFLFF